MKDCLIIVSGGMDSITMLHEYKDRIALGVRGSYAHNFGEWLKFQKFADNNL
jgi:7-cyano-7-deazaguanine synthase